MLIRRFQNNFMCDLSEILQNQLIILKTGKKGREEALILPSLYDQISIVISGKTDPWWHIVIYSFISSFTPSANMHWTHLPAKPCAECWEYNDSEDQNLSYWLGQRYGQRWALSDHSGTSERVWWIVYPSSTPPQRQASQGIGISSILLLCLGHQGCPIIVW